MIKLSTAAKILLLNTHGFASIFETGFIEIYSGQRPETPNLAPTGTRIGRVCAGGVTAAGLFFFQQNDGSLLNSGDWMLKGFTNGTAAWWRFIRDGDLAQDSEVWPRADGLVGESLILASTSITSGVTTAIDKFKLELEA